MKFIHSYDIFQEKKTFTFLQKNGKHNNTYFICTIQNSFCLHIPFSIKQKYVHQLNMCYEKHSTVTTNQNGKIRRKKILNRKFNTKFAIHILMPQHKIDFAIYKDVRNEMIRKIGGKWAKQTNESVSSNRHSMLHTVCNRIWYEMCKCWVHKMNKTEDEYQIKLYANCIWRRQRWWLWCAFVC